MPKETGLDIIESSLKKNLEEYSNMSMPDDCSKQQMSQIISKEMNILSTEKKREFDEKMRTDEFELNKDDRYHRQNLEDKRFNAEQENVKKDREFNEKKFNENLKLDERRLQNEESRVRIELMEVELAKEKLKNDRILMGVQIGTSIATLVISFATLITYKNLAYANLKLIYRDEGRPTSNFNDACKAVKNLIK